MHIKDNFLVTQVEWNLKKIFPYYKERNLPIGQKQIPSIVCTFTPGELFISFSFCRYKVETYYAEGQAATKTQSKMVSQTILYLIHQHYLKQSFLEHELLYKQHNLFPLGLIKNFQGNNNLSCIVEDMEFFYLILS